MSEKIQIVCGTCGSADVRRDAWAEWDVDKQDWVGGAVFDDGHCEVCEGESRLEELPLDDWQKQLTESQDMHSPHLGIEVEVGVEQLGDDEDKWVAIVSESDVGQIFRGTVIFAYPEEAKDAARRWAMHEREI